MCPQAYTIHAQMPFHLIANHIKHISANLLTMKPFLIYTSNKLSPSEANKNLDYIAFFSLSMGSVDTDSERNQALYLQDQHDQENKDDLASRIWVETKKLWQTAGPAIFSLMAMFSMNMITQSFAGHLGGVELAAISISNTVIVGFNYGLLVRYYLIFIFYLQN
jgi:hypothetical protein